MTIELVAAALTYLATFAVAVLLGLLMLKVFQGERTFLHPLLHPVERLIYKVCGIKEDREQSWRGYLLAMFAVTLISLVFTFVILRIQDHLPLNPAGQASVPTDLAFNTAVSFTSNTNWQNYAGETTMSYLSQMLALAFHNFLSAATGMALAIALIRGLARKSAQTLGNFYVDLVRGILYILLPLSIVATLILLANGAVQTLNPSSTAHTLVGVTQTLAQGPVASQEAIKDLGTNGGGFFNANSAHPWENPNGFTNAFEILLCLVIPFGLTITFGKWVGNVKQGLALFGAMAVILITAFGIAAWQEQSGNPAIGAQVTQAQSASQSGGNLEGKSVRFGAVQSALFGTATTGTSAGSVDSSHDSWTPLGGMMPMILMKLGEITPGGVGSGLYGIITFAILAVFIAGLMVGRTPEYLGKKIESKDVKYAAIAILIMPVTILGLTAISALVPAGTSPIGNPGSHGFSEILYAFTSSTANNGSAFAGLSGNTTYYNYLLAIAMLIGRFLLIVPIIALAGNLAKKKIVPASSGTFPTDTPLFSGLLIGVILVVGALTFFPALTLGPILEHLQLQQGILAH